VNFPALAKRTFDNFSSDPVFRRITNTIIIALKKISSPYMRARRIHREVDANLEKLLEQQIVADNISCKKGCGHCCHTQVSVTGDEAQLLAALVEGGVKIDPMRLALQAGVKNNSVAWYGLNYSQRKCIFLDEKSECMVYEDRPSVCRTNYVFDPPSQCSTEDGIEKPLRVLNTFHADMAMMAGYIYSKDNGALPNMLAAVLSQNASNKSKPPGNN